MLLEIFSGNIDDRKLDQVVECLKSGGLVVYPTDTVYSLGCDLQNSTAIEKMAKIKGVRSDKTNFSIVCSDLSHLADYSKQVDNHVFKLMKQVLPGPYTFILEGSKLIPKIFSERKKTIGIRIPDNPIARRIVEKLGRPIVATSVHDEDELLEYTTDPALIHEKMEHLVDIVIDGGPGGFEVSTILDCSKGSIEVVREGKGPIDFLN